MKRNVFSGLLLLIMLAPLGHAAEFSRQGTQVTVHHGDWTMQYALDKGTGTLAWHQTPVLKAFHSEALRTGEMVALNSEQAASRDANWEKIVDPQRGPGEKLTLTSRFADGATLALHLWFFNDARWFLSDLTVTAASEMAISRLAPIVSGFADIGPGNDKRIYTTPYSNNFDFGVAPVNDFGLGQNGTDRFANPVEPMVKFNGVSHWVTALFDNQTRHGLVAGAASVQKWKSSQQLGEARVANGPLSGFALYNWGGVQRGTVVSSDLFFLGYFDDYRDGLETYGKTYNQGEPRLNWKGAVPVGFNAFYSHDSYGKARDMEDITDYVANHLKPLGYQYVNMDGGFQPESYPQGMKTFADYVHQRGLKAGGYLTPFTIYENWLDLPIDNTGYTHRDACLHDDKGQLVKTYLGTYALDMSHPAAQYIVRRNIKNYLAWGYDYLKLDFLDMGLYEGRHHDPAINGMQNYRIGMKIMRDEVLASGHQVYLNASIAPLLPAAFTHGRRAACDTSLGVADYSGIERQAFNSAASWWSNGTLYDFNDADMFLPEQLLLGAGRLGQLAALRLATTVALGGGHWLVGDNLPFIDEDRRAWIENKALLNVASAGIAARPESMTNFYHAGAHSPSMLTRPDGNGGRYVGLTNWQNKAQRWQLTRAELGLPADKDYQITDIYSGRHWQTKNGNATFFLNAGETALLHFSSLTRTAPQGGANLLQGIIAVKGEKNYQWDLTQPTVLNKIVIKETTPFAMRNYTLSWYDGTIWKKLAQGYIVGDERTFSFPGVHAQRLRLEFASLEGKSGAPTLEAYQQTSSVYTMRISEDSVAPAETRVDVQGKNQLMQTFTLSHHDLPKLDFWLSEHYVDAVPGDNFRIRIVELDAHGLPQKNLFTAALPPFNLPAEPAHYSVFPRLTGLKTNQRYGVIFSSEGSVAEPSGKNSYATQVGRDNPWPGGVLRTSKDGGKSWQDEPEYDLLFTLYSAQPGEQHD
ncbi:hypothetical protein MUU48_03165 [Scandinavium sp. H11S7]|uniref:alpha-galactosidase n=1 Tax=Scandinavium hiltneri TaxID=2926519 RepID=UPI00216565D1|nr:hypothetical protein [Scandinavium hiltneri]MCS2155942.1 hypothetical protein [Scandinavium hiltneri]